VAKSRLHELSEHGQAVWFDTLSRDLVKTGELGRMMEEDAVTGVTSNPTIFQKALSSGDAYDDDLRRLLGETDDPSEIFFSLALQDIRDACDTLKPAYDASNGVDGYVSMEVEPGIAYDTERSFEQARWIATEVERPNLFVKIPATMAGLPAIEDCTAKGTSINITLIFSLDRYKAVVEAYLRGLERLVASGGDPSQVASVASFFVSRVDTEADKRLDAAGRPELKGKLAIANAKLAYEHYLQVFASDRWRYLEDKGATK
jgi:transaldolase